MTDSGDEIEICQSIGPHELVEAVKSKAVVKFSAVQVPVKFNRLECNTNLNLPPSNWLTTSDSSYGLHQALYQSPGFASFRMGHMFPDCVGEVDVVSDAENIKKLLKLPYTSKGAVSMIVHKVGNTLLLDEFDIQKYLLRKADDDWKWLRTFILEQILSSCDKGQNFCIKDKSREAIQTKNLLSKFLYYSLKQSSSVDDAPKQQPHQMRPPLPITAPVLPEPKVEENVPDPKSSHVFNRNVLWTFEDIRMLIGTDMPIFGGPNRPCISLRLRDMSKPINVLTGIDYWLDNLMCNVPEVVMCYHIDGIVQKYEIIKTEDLPYLENSQFSPQVVRNVAQNILAFLKANATKAGHTYWLFKGRNDDVVKLYDLTTLCKNQTTTTSDCDEKQENPFTVPVAMLLYTVARNMKNTAARITPKTAGNIRALLDNCIKLLPKEKYPQIVTSSHYILSDLHVPAGTDPQCPKFDMSELDSSDSQSVYEEDDFGDFGSDEDLSFQNDFNEYERQENVAVKNICDTLKEFHFEQHGSDKSGKRVPRAPSPLMSGTEERCRISLEHISAGISCLQYFNTNEEKFIKESEARAKDEEKQRILHEEQNPNMAKSFKPIPLPYECLAMRRQSCFEKEHSSETEVDESNSTTTVQKTEKATQKAKKTKARKAKKLKEVKDANSNINTNTHNNNAQAAQQMQNHQQVAINFNSQNFGSWNVHLKLLLLEKACLTYATLAEHKFLTAKFGASLKAIYMSYRCQLVVMKYMSTIVSQKSCLLGRAGDCLFQMAKNWHTIDESLEQFNNASDIELNIGKEIEKELNDVDDTELIEPVKNIERLMLSSITCYERALRLLDDTAADHEEATTSLIRRMGNSNNELGCKYMYWAQEENKKIWDDGTTEAENLNITDPFDSPKNCITLAMKSYACFKIGIDIFNKVQDSANLALCNCNMGRLMRFRAHLYMPEEDTDSIEKQKSFYHEAFTYYNRALSFLGSRKSNAELWDLVNWELSTATFVLAKQLQNFSVCDGANIHELEKEVLDWLQKALKLCDVEHAGSRQILYVYRSGLIHRRIASFHYNQLRNANSDWIVTNKNLLQLCKYHYEKAANILNSLNEASDLLEVQLERISLQEFLAENSTTNAQKFKHMQSALELCLTSKSLFEHITPVRPQLHDSGTQTPIPVNNTECYKHLLLFESRLQNALKTLIKLLMSGKDPKKLTDLYKKMYMETLTGKRKAGEQKLTLEDLACDLLKLMERLIQLENTYKCAAEQQQ